MPHTELHNRKKLKNYAVLAAILIFMATVFFVTLIRVKQGS